MNTDGNIHLYGSTMSSPASSNMSPASSTRLSPAYSTMSDSSSASNFQYLHISPRPRIKGAFLFVFFQKYINQIC